MSKVYVTHLKGVNRKGNAVRKPSSVYHFVLAGKVSIRLNDPQDCVLVRTVVGSRFILKKMADRAVYQGQGAGWQMSFAHDGVKGELRYWK